MTNNKLSINNEEETTLFAAYLGEEKNFFNRLKNPRSLMIILTAAVVVLLSIFFYINASGRMPIGEVAEAIKIVSFDSKWVDKKAGPDEVKIVPSISLKVKNIGSKPLKHINFIGIFDFIDTGKQMGDGNAYSFTKPLLPGKTSEEIFIKSKFGYRASSKLAFLQNAAEWKPVKAKIYVKTGTGIAEIGEFEVKQQVEGLKAGGAAVKGNQKTSLPLQAIYLDSRWVDKKVTNSKAVIVPSLTLKLQNSGDKPLQDIYLKAVFQLEKSGEVMGEGFLRVPGDSLQPGETTKEIQIKAGFGGYTARSKADFIKNKKLWQRVEARVLVRTAVSDYILLGTFPIKQEVEGVKVIYKIGT